MLATAYAWTLAKHCSEKKYTPPLLEAYMSIGGLKTGLVLASGGYRGEDYFTSS
jgi:hypothetical protein